jgi:hypothetical protein
MGDSSSGIGGDTAPAMGGALSECIAALYQIKLPLDSNGYSKRPTQWPQRIYRAVLPPDQREE